MKDKLNISELLDKKISESNQLFFPTDENDAYIKNHKLAESIADEVLSRIKGKLIGFNIFQGLLGVLDALEIEIYWANRIFNKIHITLELNQRALEFNDEEQMFDYKGLLFEIKIFAVSYNKKVVYQELKDDDLPRKLKIVNTHLLEKSHEEDLFRYEVLSEIKKEIENEITLNKEEQVHCQQLAILDETGNKKEFQKKQKDLTLDRTILLLNRLIPTFSNCDSTKKAKFINFLTGFDYETVRQRFSSINRKDAEKPSIYKEDMEIVCKYIEILGLTDLVREIKNDLDFN